MPPITPRLDISKKTVDKAKRAKHFRDTKKSIATQKELLTIRFSETLALAAEDYLEKVLDLLNQAGIRKYPPLTAKEKRPRRVDSALWEKLEKAAEGQGISRMDLVRALLNRLGDENDNRMKNKASRPTPSSDPAADDV